MGLKIYDAPDPAQNFSQDGDFTRAFSLAFDGTIGQVIQQRLYVRNDDNSKSYQAISIQPVLESGEDIIDENGFSWKMIAGDQQPLEEQWGLIDSGDAIAVPDLGTVSVSDISTYEPFWVRIEVPRGAPVKSHEGVKLRITATETDV